MSVSIIKNTFLLKHVDAVDEALLKDFLLQYPYKPYRYFMRDESLLAQYMWEKLAALRNQTENDIFVLLRGDAVVGLAAVEIVPWDSEHFGFRCAKIEYLLTCGDYGDQLYLSNLLLARIDAWCRGKAVRFISCKCENGEFAAIHALEDWGAHMVDDELTLAYPKVGKIPVVEESKYICKGFYNTRIKEITVLKKLGASFAMSRFGLDRHIPKEKSTALWEKSIENSFAGFADQVIVAYDQDMPVGFIVAKGDSITKRVFHKKSVCLLFLAAVMPEYRGKWVGKLLYTSALRWGLEHCGFVEGETQSRNYQTIHLYTRLGFHIVRSRFSFHKWF